MNRETKHMFKTSNLKEILIMKKIILGIALILAATGIVITASSLTTSSDVIACNGPGC